MLGLKPRFKEKASPKRPLVMAYIGLDDPMRGDSRGAVGVAKSVAEILDGQYVYLDEAVLRDHFKFRGEYGRYLKPYTKHLKSYMRDSGVPDIVIGTYAVDLLLPDIPNPKIIENSYNETYSRKRSEAGKMRLSCHDLDADTLKAEAKELRRRYPHMKTPLIALYLSSNFTISYFDEGLLKLGDIIGNYEQATVFVCPSRHTGNRTSEYSEIIGFLREKIKNTSIDIIGQDYESCKRGYNPYRGLIGAADHHVALGRSQSILSEVLLSGRAVNTNYFFDKAMLDKGLVCKLTDIAGKTFPDTRITPPNVTREVAQNIADEYIARYARQPA